MCVTALCTRGALDSSSRGRSTAALYATEPMITVRVFSLLIGSLLALSLFGQSDESVARNEALRRAAERDLRVQTFKSEFDSADVVALVRVQSGQVVQLEAEVCGVEASARVVEAFKGTYNEGDAIRIADAFGMGVGSHYLVFLSEGYDVEVKELRRLLGVAVPAGCEERLPSLVPVGPGVVRGNESFGINAVPKYLYFEGSWTFPDGIASPVVRFETNLGAMPKRQVETAAALASLRAMAEAD